MALGRTAQDPRPVRQERASRTQGSERPETPAGAERFVYSNSTQPRAMHHQSIKATCSHAPEGIRTQERAKLTYYASGPAFQACVHV
jgi:hypothetical protein